MGTFIDAPDENGNVRISIGCGCEYKNPDCDHKADEFTVPLSQREEVLDFMYAARHDILMLTGDHDHED